MEKELILVILIVGFVIMFVLLYFFMKQIQTGLNTSLNQNINDVRDHMDRFIDRMDQRFNEAQTRNTEFERTTRDALEQVRRDTTNSLKDQFIVINDSIEKRLNTLDTKVNENLQKGFEKTNEAFTNIVKTLGKIDEAQKNIDALSNEIISLQDVLTDKKARGAFGEVQLHHILSTVFGDAPDNVYQLQHTFKTGVRVDAALFAPEPLGTIGIDSKFPLENYQNMIDRNHSEAQRMVFEKQFSADIKKHIDDIAKKYIIAGETSDQAFMFIPAEAIFAHINAYSPDVVNYAYKKRVWLTSPTTLMSTLTTIQAILINQKRSKYAAIIHDELNKLQVEFVRYTDRWDKLKRTMSTMQQDVESINITTDKITKRFDVIASAEINQQIE